MQVLIESDLEARKTELRIYIWSDQQSTTWNVSQTNQLRAAPVCMTESLRARSGDALVMHCPVSITRKMLCMTSDL